MKKIVRITVAGRISEVEIEFVDKLVRSHVIFGSDSEASIFVPYGEDYKFQMCQALVSVDASSVGIVTNIPMGEFEDILVYLETRFPERLQKRLRLKSEIALLNTLEPRLAKSLPKNFWGKMVWEKKLQTKSE